MILIPEMRAKPKFESGDLARIKICSREVSPEGYTMICSHPAPSWGVIYEYINISSYPSSRDFLGRQIPVKESQEVVVLDYIGRPWSFIDTETWEFYDVYEILVDGYICHIFSFNLERI